MSRHYQAVVDSPPGDFTQVAEAIIYFSEQVTDGLKDLTPQGKLWDTAKRIPGLMAYRYTQLQELEAILEHLNISGAKKHAEHKKRFLEHNPRQLSDRTASDYATAETDVYELRILANEVAMVRNQFLGLTKGLEFLHFQMNNLTRLRDAGIEDAMF